TILRTGDGGETWKEVSVNLNAWLHAVAFADPLRGYIIGEKGIILRTDDGGKTWKDKETNVRSNLYAVSVASPDDVMIAGDQGRLLITKDGGENWETQATLTTSTLFAVTYRGGSNVWVAGRGGAILRRIADIATIKNSGSRGSSSAPPPSAPKLKGQENSQQMNLDTDDIPRAKPPVRKPTKPQAPL